MQEAYLDVYEAVMPPPAFSFYCSMLYPTPACLSGWAGTGYRYVLDRDPTRSDWIQSAPAEHRETRPKVFSAVKGWNIGCASPDIHAGQR